jgi:hypothetical protein
MHTKQCNILYALNVNLFKAEGCSGPLRFYDKQFVLCMDACVCFCVKNSKNCVEFASAYKKVFNL